MSLDSLTGSRAWILAGWTMLHFLWVGAVLGAIGGVVRRVARRASPERRYVLALASLGTLALAPVGIAAILSRQIEPVSSILDMREPGRVRSPLPVSLPQSPPLAEMPQTLPVAPVAAPGWDGTRLARWVAAGLPWVWVLGAPATFAMLATGLAGAERLRRASRPLSGGVWAEKVREMSRALGIAREVALAACDRVASPMLVGVVRPLILLPASALSGWTPEELELALLHELAHVRRRDNLVNLVQRLIESALFFHPAVWAASRWVRLEREHCCDRLVVSLTGRARPYAELLAALASRHAPARMSPAAAMAEAPVVDRIRQILSPHPFEDRPMPVAPPLLAVCAALILTPAALVVGQAVEAKKVVESKPLAPVAVSKEDRAKIEQLIARARRSSEVHDDFQHRIVNLISIASLKSRLGDREAARQTYLQAASLAEGIGLDESTYRPHILQWVARAQINSGFLEDGRVSLRKLLPIATGAARSEVQVAELYINMIQNFREVGDAEGVKAVEEAASRFRAASKNPGLLAQTWANPVTMKAASGDFPGALRLLDDASIYPDLKPENVASTRRRWLVETVMLVKRENRDGAEAVFEAALKDIGRRPEGGNWDTAISRIQDWSLVAVAQARSGRVADGLATAKLMLGYRERHGDMKGPLLDAFVFQTGQSFATVAEAAQAAGNREVAIEAARSAAQVVGLPAADSSRGYPRSRAIAVLARLGEVDEALALSRFVDRRYRSESYLAIAAGQREMGDEAGARKTLELGLKFVQDQIGEAPHAKEDDSDSRRRDGLFAKAAQFQARLGDMVAAKETIRRINEEETKDVTLRELAVNRARLGDLDGAMKLVGEINDRKEASGALLLMLGVVAPRKPAL